MDSDDEYGNQPVWKGVPGTIILINIFQNNKYKTFVPAHEATCRLLRQYLRSSSSQHVAVCIFGTEESNAALLDTKTIIQIIPLSLLTLDDFKKLRDINIQLYPECNEFLFSEALWQCSKIFNNLKKQLSSKTIIILTPLHVAPTELDKKPTLKRVEDLVDSGIEIRLINVSSDEIPYDPFYEKFYAIANKGLIIPLPKSVNDPLQIEQLMHQESHRNLAVAKLKFEVGNDVEIGVGLYKLLGSSQNYLKKTNLHSESNSVLTSVTKTLKVNINKDDMDTENGDKDSELPLLKSELLHYVMYGGERIEFTNAEMQSMKNPFGPSQIKLLGFKPTMMMCREKWYSKVGYFLFPNEDSIEGSTIAFKALHKACLDMSVVALCILSSRVNAKPIHVALFPSSKPLNLNVDIGFDVIPIPFVENVRDLNITNEDDVCVIKTENKNFMKDLINKTTFEYKSDMFENPEIQSKLRAIEAIALDEQDIEPFVDTTKPSSHQFEGIRDELFEDLFGPFGAMAVKRTAASTSKKESKKSKLELDQVELLSNINNKTIAKYTIAQLKEILKSKDIHDLPALNGLKKNELMDLVYKNF